MKHPLLSLTLVAVALSVLAGGARATVTLDIDQPIWTFASYDLAGNPIPNNISMSYPFGTPTADNGSTPYWTATTTFAEPVAGESLWLVNLRPDDRTVVLLNGVMVGAYGGLGPGPSTFVFTPGGPEVPQFFQNSCCEGGAPLDANVGGPFVAGLNTLEFIVNNTNHGIFGNLTDQGPSRLSFQGAIAASPPPPLTFVPEPSTWAITLVGLVVIGVGMRNRAGHRPSGP
jgi:hypothetical protein